ncbi:MAG: hypothetical protein AAF329_27435 [Cyanobacteria bacterium P01_A01_bin.17]
MSKAIVPNELRSDQEPKRVEYFHDFPVYLAIVLESTFDALGFDSRGMNVFEPWLEGGSGCQTTAVL